MNEWCRSLPVIQRCCLLPPDTCGKEHALHVSKGAGKRLGCLRSRTFTFIIILATIKLHREKNVSVIPCRLYSSCARVVLAHRRVVFSSKRRTLHFSNHPFNRKRTRTDRFFCQLRVYDHLRLEIFLTIFVQRELLHSNKFLLVHGPALYNNILTLPPRTRYTPRHNYSSQPG